LRKIESKYYIRDRHISTNSIRFGKNIVQLNANQLKDLKTKGKLQIDLQGSKIEIVYTDGSSESSAIKPQARVAKSSSAGFPNLMMMNDDQCRSFARSIYPFSKLDDDQFEELCGELYLHPGFSTRNRAKYGISSSNAGLKLFIASMPYEAADIRGQLGFIDDVNMYPELWFRFDLKTMEKELKQDPRFIRFNSRNDHGTGRSFNPLLPVDLTNLKNIANWGNRYPRKPKRFKLPTYELGIYSTYDQEWKLQGYSRGELLSSITLAPKEDLSIEIFSFDKQKIENERTFSTEFESNRELTSTAKASLKITKELTTTTDSKGNIGFGIPVPSGAIPKDLSLQGELKVTEVDKLNSEVSNLNEKTLKAAERLKSTSQVKIVQSREFGEEKRVIRKIQNPNSSRTLTFNHFEIIENHTVTTKYDPALLKFCLLVENPYTGKFDLDFILAYEDKLISVLLSGSYLTGFEAARKLAAQRWFENKKVIDAIVQAQKDAESQTEEKKIEINIIRIAKNLSTTLNKFLNADIGKAAQTIYDDIVESEENGPSDEEISDAQDAFGLSSFWFKFTLAYPGIGTKAATFIKDLGDDPDEGTAFTVIETFTTGLDDEWLTSLKMVGIDVLAGAILGVLAGPSGLIVGAVVGPLLGQLLIDKNLGLPSLIDQAKKEVKEYQLMNSAAATAALPIDPAAGTVSTPPQVLTINELALAHADFERLILHLEANRIYYTNKIWMGEDPDTRFARIRLQGLENYVENDILGFVGNKAAFSLKLGSLPTSYQDYLKKKILEPAKAIPVTTPPTTSNIVEEKIMVSIPTAGVYMESLLGKCEALEPFLLDHRNLDLRGKEAEVLKKEEEAKQALAETERYNSRLKQNPPMLDFPQPK
jgi:hypothetical protein